MTGAPPQDPDRCCSCTCCQYPNGPFQVILAQLLLFFGTFLSAAALGDCSFVTTTELSFPPFLGIPERYEDPNETGTRRGVGFFFWELHDSEKCSWELFDTNIPDRILEEIWEYYFDNVLDSQWDIARALASIAWFLSFVTWCIILALTCASVARPFRYVVAAVLVLIVTVFQACSYIVFRSRLCESGGSCEMSRGAWYSFGAIMCFALSTFCFIAMTDYPGAAPVQEKEPPLVVDAAEAEEQDVENQEGEEAAAEVVNVNEGEADEGEAGQENPEDAEAEAGESSEMEEPKQSVSSSK